MPVKKSKRRSRNNQQTFRGLPSHELLIELAKTYLKIQRSHAKTLGVKVPKATKKTLDQMVERYLSRYTGSLKLDVETELKITAVYLRYSDANSNPRSLCQQLERTLSKAVAEGLFVPWELVFADAALTGTTANRPGYQLAKDAVCGKEAICRVLIVDEIGRAARVVIETLELAQQITAFAGRLLGVSDGFDSDLPHAKMMSQQFVELSASIGFWILPAHGPPWLGIAAFQPLSAV